MLIKKKISIKPANDVAKECDNIAESCYHNINNKYKNNYEYNNKRIVPVPNWTEDLSLCEVKLATPKEQA